MSTATASRADLAALGLRHKSVDCQFKAIGENEDNTFSVYFGAFGNEDRQGDVLEPRSVRNADEYLRDGWVAWNHANHCLPIAYPTSLVQDARGVLVSGVFHTTPEAQAVRTVARERMEAGKSVKGSIGYVSADESFEKVNGRTVRRLKSVDLYECSFVNLPANPAATARAVKTAAEAPTPTDDEDPMSIEEKAAAAIEAIRQLVGLESKADGKSMSKAACTRLKSFAEAMHEHGDATREHAKAMHEHGKAAQMLGKECAKFLKAYDPDADGDDDSTLEGDTDDDASQHREVVGPKKKPKKKAEEPQDTSDASLPKSAKKGDAAALEVISEQLRRRALSGRGHQPRP